MPVKSFIPEHRLISVVVIGSFNPSIFQPLWFSQNDLVRPSEAETATIQIIHHDAAIFSTDWFKLTVVAKSLTFETTDPTKSKFLCDLVAGTFEILEHTPIDAFGVNFGAHFAMSSEESWHHLGHHFAPPASWKQVVDDPGLVSVSVSNRESHFPKPVIQVRLEPSGLMRHGVFILVNHNLNLKRDGMFQREKMDLFLKTLRNSWDEMGRYSDEAYLHLLTADTAKTDTSGTEQQ